MNLSKYYDKTSFERSHTAASVPPTLQQVTAGSRLCCRLLDTHRQVWVSVLWGHSSFLLNPGAHTVLFVLCSSWI